MCVNFGFATGLRNANYGQILFCNDEHTPRAVARALIGGGVYSCIRVMPDQFPSKLTLIPVTTDFKRN